MNSKFKERVEHFLAQKNIAVAGYARRRPEVANGLYDKFKENGYSVFAVNPKYTEVKDVECFPNLKAIPVKVEAVMISTPPSSTMGIVKECIELGIKHVWIHKSFGGGSYNKEAVDLAEKNGLEIIPMACPMMFLKADGFHKCVRWFMSISGKLKV